MKLAQLTTFKGEEGVVAKGQELLAAFMEEPVFQAMEFTPEPSDYKMEPTKKTTLASVTRKEGDNVTRTRLTGSPTLGEQAIYGHEFAMDQFRTLDENVGASDEFIRLRAERKIAKYTRIMSQTLAAHVISGVGNASTNEQIYGLGTIIADAAAAGQTAWGDFTPAELADMRTAINIDLTTQAAIEEFLATLEREVALVPNANGLIMNRFLKSRITTLARHRQVLSNVTNLFNQTVDALFGVPIIVIPDAGIPIDSDTWTDHPNACSMYIVRNNEEEGLDYPSNSGFYYKGFGTTDQDQDKVSGVHIHLNARISNDNAVRRLSQIGLQPYENITPSSTGV